YDFGGDFAGPVELAGGQADGADAGVAAAAVALANGGQVVFRLFRRPGVRPYRDLGAETGWGHRDRVSGTGEKIVGDELVVTFDVITGEIEEHDVMVLDGAALNEVDGFHVPLVERLVECLDFGLGDDFRELPVLHPADDLLHDGSLGGLDDQRELHGRGAQLTRGAGAGNLTHRRCDPTRP